MRPFGNRTPTATVLKNLKISHNTCKKFLTITKLHKNLLSKFFDKCLKFCQKFLKELVFKFFETIVIF